MKNSFGSLDDDVNRQMKVRTVSEYVMCRIVFGEDSSVLSTKQV